MKTKELVIYDEEGKKVFGLCYTSTKRALNGADAFINNNSCNFEFFGHKVENFKVEIYDREENKVVFSGKVKKVSGGNFSEGYYEIEEVVEPVEEKTENEVKSYSLPDYGMVHIVISNGKKDIAKTYKSKGCFLSFMLHHGLLDEGIKIATRIW